MGFPIKELQCWFEENKRDFPWRENATPYRVWVSEMMLQQTQASVVIPYFERWMERFPQLSQLAEAQEVEVIKLWEGLGYYSRALNLYHGAQYCVTHFGGELPHDPQKLAAIKGIGPYTLGAILSFAFHEKAAAIDGNVERVLSRFYALDTSRKEMEKIVLQFLPDRGAHIISEALIELGALICQKVPKCLQCPLQQYCEGYKRGVTQDFPKRKQRVPTTKLMRAVALIRQGKKWLVMKGEKGKVMGELYEFPYLEMPLTDVQAAFEKKLQLKLTAKGIMPSEEHSFTRYRVTLFPHLFECTSSDAAHLWHEDPHSLPFSSGHRRLLQQLRGRN